MCNLPYLHPLYSPLYNTINLILYYSGGHTRTWYHGFHYRLYLFSWINRICYCLNIVVTYPPPLRDIIQVNTEKRSRSLDVSIVPHKITMFTTNYTNIKIITTVDIHRNGILLCLAKDTTLQAMIMVVRKLSETLELPLRNKLRL